MPAMAAIGIVAFTTTRGAGSFALGSAEPSDAIWSRWLALAGALSPHAPRLAFAHQVHGATVVTHRPGWNGILRVPDADGHLSLETPTAMAVTLADCVPVFIGHPSGAASVVHSGWQGTAARITEKAVHRMSAAGLDPADLVVHCGPSICGQCYEVGPEVYQKLTGQVTAYATPVDLRALIAESAQRAGVKEVSVSIACTRHHNDRFFSHRTGDIGRQLAVIVAHPQVTSPR
ncbi:MAG: polyphenol oxidase family protein [Cytophagaceae bacterium]|nr:polyphenol oxidase family protein [Gemmatimonadaceae bacterium]